MAKGDSKGSKAPEQAQPEVVETPEASTESEQPKSEPEVTAPVSDPQPTVVPTEPEQAPVVAEAAAPAAEAPVGPCKGDFVSRQWGSGILLSDVDEYGMALVKLAGKGTVRTVRVA